MDELFSLPSGVDLDKLMTTGIVFDSSKIQEAFDNIDDDFEQLVLNEAAHVSSHTFEPNVDEPYSELWNKMKPLESNDQVRKTILKKGEGERPSDDSIVTLLYNGYTEKEESPFMNSGKFTTSKFDISKGGLLPGLELAVRSMSIGEKSQFLIHHSLMYGDLGYPPLIPKKAMCLINLSLLEIEKKIIREDNESVDNIPHFALGVEKVNALSKTASGFQKNGYYLKAAKQYEKAYDLMCNCRLANDEEEEMQKEILCNLCLKLAICYNKANLPKKSCLFCNEYSKIKSAKASDHKIFIEKIKALKAIGDYATAMKCVSTAMRVFPKIDEFKAFKKSLEESKTKYEEIFTAPIEVSFETESPENEDINDDKYNTIVPVSEEFKKEIDGICSNIINEKKDSYQYFLPPGLTLVEIEQIIEIAALHSLNACYDAEENDICFTKDVEKSTKDVEK